MIKEIAESDVSASILYTVWWDWDNNSNKTIYPWEKKEEIWLSPMTNAPTLTEKSKKQRDNIKNATKNFDYTTIADDYKEFTWPF